MHALKFFRRTFGTEVFFYRLPATLWLANFRCRFATGISHCLGLENGYPLENVLYPFLFQPIFKERIWGGREIETLFGKKLPPGKPIGESWEVSDRPSDESVVQNGEHAGKSLHWLMEKFPREILGDAKAAAENRFPILCKILDAREKLSLQVHPPAHKAAAMGGEPKTEMWFIAGATPDAELYVGLKNGVTRAQFEKKLSAGTVADCFHRIPVKPGDTMFLPSGRVHAIGGGLVIFEIQQNSDTTYRLFDWNRMGTDGKPRELHVAQSLASMDFNDFEPKLVTEKFSGDDRIKSRPLVRDALFDVDHVKMRAGAGHLLKPRKLQIVAVVSGQVKIQCASPVSTRAGQFCLIPAALEHAEVSAESDATWLRVEAH
jgi:mannose-6-phosphate isomerase